MVVRTESFIVRRVPSRHRREIDARFPASVAPGGGADTLWSATIHGEPTPAARLHEIVLTDGSARLVRSRPARLWQTRVLPQLLNRRPRRPFAADLALDCRFWLSSQRSPVDEALVIEVLERAAIIVDRRQIREKHVFTAVDRGDPRVAISLAPAAGRP